jgi:hypothetical protein
MSSGRQGTTSASFSMPLLCTVYDFWQVSPRYYYSKYGITALLLTITPLHVVGVDWAA